MSASRKGARLLPQDAASLARYLPRGVTRADLHDEDCERRVERRLGRKLEQGERSLLRYARNAPAPLEARAYYHERGFRLVAWRHGARRGLDMARDGRFWHGGKVCTS